jgi:UDP-N-acetylglucosamine 2-epimerase
MNILHVVGARPNFMKAAPVMRALKKRDVRQALVHTGQHYDKNMSDVFFSQLAIPAPDWNLGWFREPCATNGRDHDPFGVSSAACKTGHCPRLW